MTDDFVTIFYEQTFSSESLGVLTVSIHQYSKITRLETGSISVFKWGGDSYSVVKVKVIRLTVGLSVLVSGTHLGPATNFSHSLYFF
jgi:hypothetical protein